MANRVTCRTANVWEKAIPSLNHHPCWVLDKTTPTRIIQVATHQQSDNLWRETWRILNISSRLTRAIQPQPILILAKEDPLQCLIRQILIDLPSRRITSTTREICSEESSSMEWDRQSMLRATIKHKVLTMLGQIKAILKPCLVSHAPDKR